MVLMKIRIYEQDIASAVSIVLLLLFSETWFTSFLGPRGLNDDDDGYDDDDDDDDDGHDDDDDDDGDDAFILYDLHYCKWPTVGEEGGGGISGGPQLVIRACITFNPHTLPSNKSNKSTKSTNSHQLDKNNQFLLCTPVNSWTVQKKERDKNGFATTLIAPTL